MRFECAFGFVLRAERKDFSGIGRAQEDFSGRVPHDAGDLRRAGFRKLRENAAAINREKRAAVAGARQKAPVRSESQRVDQVFARGPEFFRSTIGADAVNAAG